MKRPIAVLILAILVLGMFGLAKVPSAHALGFFSSVTGEFRMDGDSKWRCYVNTTLTNLLGDVVTIKWICMNASVIYVDDTSDELGIIENRTLDLALMSDGNYTTGWVVTEFGFDTQPKTLRLESVASTDHGMQYDVSYVEAPLLYEIVAPYGSTPTIDGTVHACEWGDATSKSFSSSEAFVKQDGESLYIALNVTDAPLMRIEEDCVQILLDVDFDRDLTLQTDDVGLGVYRNGTLVEANVTSGTWTLTEATGWTAAVNSTSDMWQVEFNITYPRINVVAGVYKDIGASIGCAYYPEEGSPTWVSWPPNTYSNMTWNPSTWGTLTSTGYNWIPEFPSFLIVPLFMAIVLLTIVPGRREKAGRASDRSTDLGKLAGPTNHLAYSR